MISTSLQLADLAGLSPASCYLKASAAVCPFIEASVKAGCLYTSEVALDCRTAQDISPRLFEQIVPRIEQFRQQRQALAQKQQRLLICHVVIIQLAPSLDMEAVRVLDWPNWTGLLLKQLYTPKEIVFGFVRKTVGERSSLGIAIPPAPFHAVIIRSRVTGTDERFFHGNDALLKAVMEAEDDGADVHAAALGDVPDIRDPDAMRNANYFERVRQWGHKTLVRG